MNSLRFNSVNNFKQIKHSAGGMTMKGRNYQASTGSYRYSINGQEIESELNKNITTALYWEYDSRIARRWNLDPLAHKFQWQSTYCVMENNPINKIDPDGMEATDWFKDKKGLMQYDPNVKSQADVGDKGTYVGAKKQKYRVEEVRLNIEKTGAFYFQTKMMLTIE